MLGSVLARIGRIEIKSVMESVDQELDAIHYQTTIMT